MFLALFWQQKDAYEEYTKANLALEKLIKQKNTLHEFIEREIYDNLKISQCKLNCTTFIALAFTIFPSVYHIALLGYIDSNEFYVIISMLSFASKSLFSLIVTDSHVEILGFF
jgi:hypothetical protein